MMSVTCGEDVRSVACRVAILVLAIALPSCGGDDGPTGGVVATDVDMAGIWTFTASAANPPRTVNCSGNEPEEELCSSFVVDLGGTGPFYETENPTQEYCGAVFDVEGIVAGNVFSGTIYRRVPLNNEIDAISFEATVAGDSATVSPFSLLNELTLDLCEVAGVYSATRAP